MQATREICTKLIERAMLALNIGLGVTGALLAMAATLATMLRGE